MLTDWISYAQWWGQIVDLGNRRNAGKESYDSALYMATNSHTWGVVGEVIYAILTGNEVNQEIRAAGDDEDFSGGRDVKAVRFWTDPHLKLMPGDRDKPINYWILVAIKEYEKTAKLIGWCSREDFENLKEHDYNYGLREYWDESTLHPGLDPLGQTESGISACPGPAGRT